MMDAHGLAQDREATPYVELRAAPRFSVMMRTAKLLCESGEYLCIVRDVSATGTKLRLFHEPPPDTHLFLELGNGDRYAMERMWYHGHHAGFRFSSSIDVDEFIGESSPHPRRSLRLRLQLPALVTANATEGEAMLLNISQHGACIETGRQLAVGGPLRLDICGLPLRFGHVSWRRGRVHGLVFQQAFRLDELARHAQELQPFGAVPANATDDLEARCA